MKNLSKELEIILDYNFKNSDLLRQSLIHKSFNNFNNNEKLEFLGDRVLGLVISKKLIEIYPNEKEGIIDKKFANLVNKKTCSSIANKLNIKKFMFLGASHKSLQKFADKIIGDCLEALIGAIYLDGGLKYAEKFSCGIKNNKKNIISRFRKEEPEAIKYKTLATDLKVTKKAKNTNNINQLADFI